MKRWDLIVIGTGLAGLTAARTALDIGARVLVVAGGWGRSPSSETRSMSWGRYLPGEPRCGGRRLDCGAYRSPLRPDWLGRDRGGAHRLSCTFSVPYNFIAAGMQNSLVPTGAGTLRPTYLLPVTMRAGAGIAAAETLIVGFRGFKDFQGDTVSLHLKCRGVNISLPRYGLEGLSAFALARLMDEVQFRKGLGEAIRGRRPEKNGSVSPPSSASASRPRCWRIWKG